MRGNEIEITMIAGTIVNRRGRGEDAGGEGPGIIAVETRDETLVKREGRDRDNIRG